MVLERKVKAGQVGSGKRGLGWFGKVWQVWRAKARFSLACLGTVWQAWCGLEGPGKVRFGVAGRAGSGGDWTGLAGQVRRGRQGMLGAG